jgi:uncharacterized protein (DUF1015 family)
MSTKEKLARLGLNIPEILLPGDRSALDRWAVVACDQFSSDKSYWKKVEDRIGTSPSTLKLILPECYLDESENRVPEINRTMKDYLDSGVLEKAGEGFVYLERSTPWTKNRKGLMVALDLEAYSYELGAECRIRPTEGTVLERLPVRAEIRRNAVLDLPHILVLIDDPEEKLFSLLDGRKADFETLYDFDLSDGAGHISGSLVSGDAVLTELAGLFEELDNRGDFLFAVGDGNHSLGAAKQLWNRIKEETGDMNHPARYALVELENIHDPGVRFEPIHRVLFDCDETAFRSDFGSRTGCEITDVPSLEEMKKAVDAQTGTSPFLLGMISERGYAVISMDDEDAYLPSEAFHTFLDPWADRGGCREIEYIHGEEVLVELGSRKANLGFYLPAVDKKSFFGFISSRGPMPRKTFSIGEAEEKRYYLEGRKLIY